MASANCPRAISMRPTLNRIIGSLGAAAAAFRYDASASSTRPSSSASCPRLAERAGVARVDGERQPEHVGGLDALALRRETDAEVVVGFGGHRADPFEGTIVRLGLRPVLLAAVKSDQVHVCGTQLRVGLNRRLVFGDRAGDIALFLQGQPAFHMRACVIAQGPHAGDRRVVNRRPCRTELLRTLDCLPGLGGASQATQHHRFGVPRGAEFREQLHGGLDLAQRRLFLALRGQAAAQAVMRVRGAGTGGQR